MKPEIKAKWIEALRSGDYKQTTLRLRTDEGFCYQGVLCDLHSQETGGKWRSIVEVFGIRRHVLISVRPQSGVRVYCGATGELPDEVRDWAGVAIDDMSVLTWLANRNDNGWTFEQIADALEVDLNEVPKHEN